MERDVYEEFGRMLRTGASRRPVNLFNDPPRKLAPGRYRVTLEGKVTEGGVFHADDCSVTLAPWETSRIRSRFERLPDPAPEWQPGDVVVFRPFSGSISYTYVRGARNWPGDARPAKTDEQITAWWRAGKIRPVLQAGGVPFDESRIK